MASSSTASAQEASPFPWSAQVAVVDTASPEGAQRLADLIEQAHERTITYLDWTLKNADASGLFDQLDAGDDTAEKNQALCARVERKASNAGGYLISGKPDPQNNHLLVRIRLDLTDGAPFARARCEYAEGSHALRIRGFFYVTNIGTATANNLEFQPVAIPAHVIPAEFLEHLK